MQQYARCSTVWAREWGPRRPGARAPQIMYKVFAGQKPPVDRGAMPGGFRDLLESCWENDPAARPSFREQALACQPALNTLPTHTSVARPPANTRPFNLV